MDYFDKDTTLFWVDEPRRMEEKNAAFTKEFQENMKHRLEKGYILPGQTNMLFGYEDIFRKLCGRRTLFMTRLEQQLKQAGIKEEIHINTRNINSYNGNFELLINDLKRYKKNKYRIIIFTGSSSRAARLASWSALPT